MENRTGTNERTLAIARICCRHLLGHLGVVQLDKLDFSTLDDYQKARQAEAEKSETTVAAGTINLELNKMRAAWSWGRDRNYVPDRRLKLPKVQGYGRRKYTPTRKEWTALLGWAERIPWFHRLLLIQGCTGARIHEVAQLQWSDVDLEGCIIRIPENTKGGSRPVFIDPSLSKHLAETPERERRGAILTNVAERTVMTGTYQHLKRACEELCIPRFGTHALRRMVVDAYYRNGAEIKSVAEQLGQSPETAIRYYRKATSKDKRKAVEKAGLGVPDMAEKPEDDPSDPHN